MTSSASRQVLVAVGVGAVVGATVGVAYRLPAGALIGYDVAVLVYVTRVWLHVWPLNAAQTARLAAGEDPARTVTDVVLLVAAVLSLGAVGTVIAMSRDDHGSIRGVEVAFGVVTVALSWLLIQTIFSLLYARLYYGAEGGPNEGGVNFEDHVRPVYSDFAYLAFTVGMTFQLSDTDLQTSEFRRAVLRHALLSYLFGAVILAATINLVASLAN